MLAMSSLNKTSTVPICSSLLPLDSDVRQLLGSEDVEEVEQHDSVAVAQRPVLRERIKVLQQ